MPRNLKLTRFGNPVLRKPARALTSKEIMSERIQKLISDMYYTLRIEQYGVGLAAPQVGKSFAFSIIGIKPTPTRPHEKEFETVIINPKIVETFGKLEPMWEGCVSCGTGDDIVYAQAPRFRKIRLEWTDENNERHSEILSGLAAHVAQHETAHLHGELFVDKADPATFMMADEFRKRIVRQEYGK